MDESVDSLEFLEITRNFCQANKDKKGIIVLLDHLLLVTESKPGENAMKKVSEYTNILRKEFGNVYFLYLSQLNRDAYADVKEKSNQSVPNVTHVYGSSHFEFLSSFVVIMFNPYKLGVENYMKIKPDRYPEYRDFFTISDNKGNVNFNTLGNMFFHIVKIRESDFSYENLHIEKMNISDEQLKRMTLDREEKDSVVGNAPIPVFAAPVFDMTKKVANPNDMSKHINWEEK